MSPALRHVHGRGGRLRSAAVGALLAGALLLGACGGPDAPSPAPGAGVEKPADGTIRSAASCAPCHPHETGAWELSAHARHGIARNSPPGGAHAAVGTRWMQAYLRRDALGLHRIVPTCYDLRDGVWRYVPDVLREISGMPELGRNPLDLLGRSFDTGCSGCHASGTALTGGQGTLAVTASWRTLGLDCFVCHGPAVGHDAGGAGRMPRLQDLSPRGRTMVCGRCHGGPPVDGDLAPAEAEGFVTFLGDRAGMNPDGTTAGQIYQVSPFLRSPCHLKGGLTCTGCHDAHGEGGPAASRGDALCTTCHTTHASPAHTHHAAASPGARCIECHMPRLLTGLLRHQREHRIGIPQPWQEVATDACTACHRERDKAWARSAWSSWWGEPPRATLAAAQAVAGSRSGSHEADAELRIAWTSTDPLFRAVALQRLGVLPGAESDPLPEVRLVAAESAPVSEEGTGLLRALLGDALPRIRGEAAVALAQRGVALSASQLADVAVVARLARQHVGARRVLADAARAQAHWAEAEAELAEVVALEPADLENWLAWADTQLRSSGLALMQATVDRALSVVTALGVGGSAGERYVADLASRRVLQGRRPLALALLDSAGRLWPEARARERFRDLAARLRRSG